MFEVLFESDAIEDEIPANVEILTDCITITGDGQRLLNFEKNAPGPPSFSEVGSQKIKPMYVETDSTREINAVLNYLDKIATRLVAIVTPKRRNITQFGYRNRGHRATSKYLTGFV